MRIALLGFVTAASTTSWLVACSGDSVVVGGADATTDTMLAVDAPSDTASGMDADAAACNSMPRGPCLGCCGLRHPQGASVFGSAIAMCACQPDKCFDACAPTCLGDAAASVGCTTCVTTVANTKGDAGCQDQIAAACSASQACKEYFACALSCPPN